MDDELLDDITRHIRESRHRDMAALLADQLAVAARVRQAEAEVERAKRDAALELDDLLRAAAGPDEVDQLAWAEAMLRDTGELARALGDKARVLRRGLSSRPRLR